MHRTLIHATYRREHNTARQSNSWSVPMPNAPATLLDSLSTVMASAPRVTMSVSCGSRCPSANDRMAAMNRSFRMTNTGDARYKAS